MTETAKRGLAKFLTHPIQGTHCLHMKRGLDCRKGPLKKHVPHFVMRRKFCPEK